jgi:hypothetical protein
MTNKEARMGIVSRQYTAGQLATHILKNQDKRQLQALKAARHDSYSPTGEPKAGIFNWLKMQQGTAATHFLERQRQAPSAGLKCSKAQQPLTS